MFSGSIRQWEITSNQWWHNIRKCFQSPLSPLLCELNFVFTVWTFSFSWIVLLLTETLVMNVFDCSVTRTHSHKLTTIFLLVIFTLCNKTQTAHSSVSSESDGSCSLSAVATVLALSGYAWMTRVCLQGSVEHLERTLQRDSVTFMRHNLWGTVDLAWLDFQFSNFHSTKWLQNKSLENCYQVGGYQDMSCFFNITDVAGAQERDSSDSKIC